MIALNGVSKVFEAEDVFTHAVRDASLIVEKGDYISIQGASGSGKSTLLHLLGLLDSPSSGSYVLNGHDVTGLSAAQRASFRATSIGFIFQSFNLLGDLSVIENVMLPMKFGKAIGSARERERLAMRSLSRVGLVPRSKHRPHQLSGGQQQRVAIARAIASNPSVILADEPTGNLDSSTGKEIMEILSDLNCDGATIIMVTHDVQHALQARRRMRMVDGLLESA